MKRLFALLIILALTPLSAQSTVRDCEELATQIGQNASQFVIFLTRAIR